MIRSRTPRGDGRVNEIRQPNRAARWKRLSLWVLAVVLMLSAAVYQRLTGPTYRMRGEFEAVGGVHKYRLIRSAYSTHDTLVTVPDPGSDVTGSLYYKRYNTPDEFTPVQLVQENGGLGARLPAQPAAGKLEYYLVLNLPTGALRIPETAAENVIIRFKDRTPISVLLPHVLLMFFAMLIGVRAAFAALFDPGGMRPLAWLALALMTVGGMILGPIVQKFSFGEYWTGFPFGYDLTDNKTLILWLVWVIACFVIGFKPRSKEAAGRATVVVAALAMMVVYLIPHSLRGSELDYSQLDAGVPASEAVEVGR